MQRKKLPPIHPGQILREELLKPCWMTAKQLAKSIKFEEEIVAEKGEINADISYRLGLYFGFRED